MDFPEDIYSNRILEVVATMPPAELLEKPDGSGVRNSKLCGSKVRVDLEIKDGHISKYGHELEACLLGQTAAAVMARNALDLAGANGLTRADVVAVRDDMLAMLKEDGPPPTGIWSDLEVLYPVKDYKPRHTSMMLVFEAVLDAFDDAAGKSAAHERDGEIRGADAATFLDE